MPLEIAFCWAPPGGARRARDSIDRVIVHRIAVSQEDPTYQDTPAEVIRFFATHPIGRQATGGTMPYPLLVDHRGQVSQCAPLSVITMHARQYNARAIGVGLLGDFRHAAPTSAQRRALIYVGAYLLAHLQLSVDALCAHDGLTGASADPDKECPGRFLPMEPLRVDVAEVLQRRYVPLDFVW